MLYNTRVTAHLTPDSSYQSPISMVGSNSTSVRSVVTSSCTIAPFQGSQMCVCGNKPSRLVIVYGSCGCGAGINVKCAI